MQNKLISSYEQVCFNHTVDHLNHQLLNEQKVGFPQKMEEDASKLRG